jgi:hypothetical protein
MAGQFTVVVSAVGVGLEVGGGLTVGELIEKLRLMGCVVQTVLVVQEVQRPLVSYGLAWGCHLSTFFSAGSF